MSKLHRGSIIDIWEDGSVLIECPICARVYGATLGKIMHCGDCDEPFLVEEEIPE